jgi:hypothetical protein
VKQILIDQVIDTDYGQLDLVWTEDGGFNGDFDRFFAGQVNGLVGASDAAGVYLNLARRSGGSSVRIVLLDMPPAGEDASWGDVVEVSFYLAATRHHCAHGDRGRPILAQRAGSSSLRSALTAGP